MLNHHRQQSPSTSISTIYVCDGLTCKKSELCNTYHKLSWRLFTRILRNKPTNLFKQMYVHYLLMDADLLGIHISAAPLVEAGLSFQNILENLVI